MQKLGALPKPNIRIRQSETGKPDYWLLAVVAMLLILGTIMVYSASFVTAARINDNPAYFLWRHLLWLGLGLVGCFVMSVIDYHRWRRFSIVAMIGVLVLLLAVLVLPSPIAPSIDGAKRWIALTADASWMLQPSELAKIVLILYGAHWLSSKGDKIRNLYYGLIPFALTVGVLVALIMGEPDLGTSLVIGTIGLGLFFIAGANILHILVGLIAAGGAFYILANAAAYRLNRLSAYQDPFSDPTGLGYHTVQALFGLGSGGIFGVGLGVSRQKFMWLPTVFTDSIFAVIGEELGMVGTGLVVLLFVTFAWRGFRIALHAPDGFGRLIASGFTIYVVAQAFLNMAVVTNLVPFTGIPLPLISYGGSSLSVTLIGLGLLLNVSRQQVADPRQVELEERRQAERRQRDLLREQRQASREQHTSAKKLHEAEQAEKQAAELAQAQKRWYERTRAEREAEREAERQRQEKERLRQEIERGAEAARRKQARQRETARAESSAPNNDIPDLAARSYLDFRSQSGRDSKTSSQDEEHLRPKLRRPRRDWAKVYHNAAQPKREGRPDD